MKFFWIGAVLLAILVAVVGLLLKGEGAVPHESEFKSSVMGWMPYWDQDEAVQTFKNNVDLFHSIGLFWYYIGSDGKVSRYTHAKEDQKLISLARENNVEVLVSVSNVNDDKGRGWSSDLVEQVIGDDSREGHADEIVSLVVSESYDGVIIDYEGLNEELRNNFSSFIRQLADKLHEKDKRLGVTVLPITEDGEEGAIVGAKAQDLEIIASVADYVYVMAYGKHGKYTEPGPIAPLPWVEKVLSYAQARVPADKMFMGVPIYGYDWEKNKEGHGLTHWAGLAVKRQWQPEVSYDDRLESARYEYGEGQKKHVVWEENERSLVAKLNLFKERGVGNLSFWRLGNDDPETWELVRGWAK